MKVIQNGTFLKNRAKRKHVQWKWQWSQNRTLRYPTIGVSDFNRKGCILKRQTSLEQFLGSTRTILNIQLKLNDQMLSYLAKQRHTECTFSLQCATFLLFFFLCKRVRQTAVRFAVSCAWHGVLKTRCSSWKSVPTFKKCLHFVSISLPTFCVNKRSVFTKRSLTTRRPCFHLVLKD